MATAESVKGKLTGLIHQANATTGSDATTLSDAVAALVAGFGASDGLCMESGEYIPSQDTTRPDVEVSQAAHDGCFIMMMVGDEDDLHALADTTNTLRCMHMVCMEQLYQGEFQGINVYPALWCLLNNAINIGASTGLNVYSGGPHVVGRTIRFACNYALGIYRAGVTYRWTVYYTKEAGT